MYKPTSNQSSFFEPHYLFHDFLPKDDWSDIFRDKIWPLIDEEKFKHLYQEEGGAPNRSIKLKLSLLIFMSWEQLTWRRAEFDAAQTSKGSLRKDYERSFKRLLKRRF